MSCRASYHCTDPTVTCLLNASGHSLSKCPPTRCTLARAHSRNGSLAPCSPSRKLLSEYLQLSPQWLVTNDRLSFCLAIAWKLSLFPVPLFLFKRVTNLFIRVVARNWERMLVCNSVVFVNLLVRYLVKQSLQMWRERERNVIIIVMGYREWFGYV